MSDGRESTMTNQKKTCFVLTGNQDEESESKRRVQQIVRHVIAPAAAQNGYSIELSDSLPHSSTVSPELIEHMMGEDLVVADLTTGDPVMWYGLAIRHSFHRPTIHVIEDGVTSPFIAPGVRVVAINHHDLDSVDATRKEIAAMIKASGSDDAVESPISVAAELNHLRYGDFSGDGNTGLDITQIEGLLTHFKEEVKAELAESISHLAGTAPSAQLDTDALQEFRESFMQELREQAAQRPSPSEAPELDQNQIQALVNTYGNAMLLTSSMATDHPQNEDLQMIGSLMTQLGNDLMALTGVQTFESYDEDSSLSWAEDIQIGEPIPVASEA